MVTFKVVSYDILNTSKRQYFPITLWYVKLKFKILPKIITHQEPEVTRNVTGNF